MGSVWLERARERIYHYRPILVCLSRAGDAAEKIDENTVKGKISEVNNE